MSELLLYIVATAVVLAGVAYFFIKQREQEALDRRTSTKQQGRGKKEPKAPKEPKERKPREEKPKSASKPAAKKEQPAPVVTSSKKKKSKDEDETKGVLEFLKGKKFTTDKSEKTAQAKVKTAPAQTQQKAPKPARIEFNSDSETDSEDEGYDLIKRKVKSTKEKAEEVAGAAVDAVTGENQSQKKKKFFTKAEEAEYKAKREAAKAEREARKNRPPGEKRERRKKQEGDEEGEFTSPKERRPRRERAPRGEGEEGAEEEGERRRKFPPREPDAAPVFAADYETADMDNLLNSLTSFYNANPQAGRTKKTRPAKQESEGKAEEADE